MTYLISFLSFLFTISTPSQVCAISNRHWAYCSPQKQAYKDSHFRYKKSKSNWICRLPSPSQTDDVEENLLKCYKSRKFACKKNAGGEDLPGSTNTVPKNAFFYILGQSDDFPYLKCSCINNKS